STLFPYTTLFRSLIAHRHRHQRALGPLRGIPDDARALAGKIRRDGMTEAEALDVAAQPLGADLEPDLDRADVARADDDVAERQDAVVVVLRFGDDARAEPDHAGVGIDQRVDRHDVLFDRRRHGHDL